MIKCIIRLHNVTICFHVETYSIISYECQKFLQIAGKIFISDENTAANGYARLVK